MVPSGQPESAVSYYYDLGSEQLLIGEAALEYHLESGGHPADIVPFGEALTNKSITISASERRAPRDGLDKAAAIADGRFLVGIVHRYDPAKSVTSRVMEKAWNLGVIENSPSQVRTSKTFGKFIDYQEAIGETNIFRRSAFDHMTYDDFVDHLRSVAAEEGRKPTIHTLSERIDRGLVEPSPAVIRRLIHPKSFYDLYGSAGLAETVHHWTNERMELFGLSYMWANKGRVPSARALMVLSRKNLGPTHQGIIGRFRYLTSFQDKIVERFNSQYDGLVTELDKRIKKAEVPYEITTVSADEWKVVTAYLAYKAIEEFSPRRSSPTRIFKIAESLTTSGAAEFREAHPEIDMELMMDYAKENGFDGAIWPRESGMRQSFRLKKKGRIMVKVASPQNGAVNDIRQEYRKRLQERAKFTELKESLFDSDAFRKYIRQRGQEIKAALEEGEVPVRLFAGSKNGRIMARRYEVYTAMSKIMPDLSDIEKTRISILSDGDKLSAILNRQDIPVSPSEVESWLAQLGFALVN